MQIPADGESLMVYNISDFKKKYGTDTLLLLVGKYIRQSGDFPGCNELAFEIGSVLGDLIYALHRVE